MDANLQREVEAIVEEAEPLPADERLGLVVFYSGPHFRPDADATARMFQRFEATVRAGERERDELRQSVRDVRRVLAERLEEIGPTAGNEIIDVLHESAWTK